MNPAKNRISNSQKLIVIFIILSACLGCAGSPQTRTASKTLDQALYEAAEQINIEVPPRTIIALVNFNTPARNLNDYCLMELERFLIGLRNLNIVDRAEIELRRNELNLQYSGEVSDRTMRQLGVTMGAENIVSGSISEIKNGYRIRVRVLNVESGIVITQYSSDIADDARFRSVSGLAGSGSRAQKNNSMKELRIGVAAQGAPIMDTGFSFTETGLFTIGMEMGYSSFGFDLNYTRYLNANMGLLSDEIGSKASSLGGAGFGIHYSFFGSRWILTLGPGITYIIHDDMDNFVSPYGQARFDFRLSGYDLFGIYLRLGYRLDVNNPAMAEYKFINDLDNKKWFLTHGIIAGLILTIP